MFDIVNVMLNDVDIGGSNDILKLCPTRVKVGTTSREGRGVD